MDNIIDKSYHTDRSHHKAQLLSSRGGQRQKKSARQHRNESPINTISDNSININMNKSQISSNSVVSRQNQIQMGFYGINNKGKRQKKHKSSVRKQNDNMKHLLSFAEDDELSISNSQYSSSPALINRNPFWSYESSSDKTVKLTYEGDFNDLPKRVSQVQKESLTSRVAPNTVTLGQSRASSSEQNFNIFDQIHEIQDVEDDQSPKMSQIQEMQENSSNRDSLINQKLQDNSSHNRDSLMNQIEKADSQTSSSNWKVGIIGGLAEMSQKFHRLKEIQEQTKQSNQQLLEDIETSQHIQTRMEETVQSEVKKSTLQRLRGELGKLQDGIQVHLEDKMQQNFNSELLSIKDAKRYSRHDNISSVTSNSRGYSKSKGRVSDLDEVGTSANIKNSTYGTQISRSLFTDCLSNYSALEEHELIQQSKLADQKIKLLEKQVNLLEHRKKIENLLNKDEIQPKTMIDYQSQNNYKNFETDVYRSVQKAQSVAVEVYEMPVEEEIHQVPVDVLNQQFVHKGKIKPNIDSLNSETSLAKLAKQYDQEQKNRQFDEMSLKLKTSSDQTQSQSPNYLLQMHRASSITTTEKQQTISDIDFKYLQQVSMLIQLLQKEESSQVFGQQIQFLYDNHVNLCQTNSSLISKESVRETYLKLQKYLVKFNTIHHDQIDMQVHLILSILDQLQQNQTKQIQTPKEYRKINPELMSAFQNRKKMSQNLNTNDCRKARSIFKNSQNSRMNESNYNSNKISIKTISQQSIKAIGLQNSSGHSQQSINMSGQVSNKKLLFTEEDIDNMSPNKVSPNKDQENYNKKSEDEAPEIEETVRTENIYESQDKIVYEKESESDKQVKSASSVKSKSEKEDQLGKKNTFLPDKYFVPSIAVEEVNVIRYEEKEPDEKEPAFINSPAEDTNNSKKKSKDKLESPIDIKSQDKYDFKSPEPTLKKINRKSEMSERAQQRLQKANDKLNNKIILELEKSSQNTSQIPFQKEKSENSQNLISSRSLKITNMLSELAVDPVSVNVSQKSKKSENSQNLKSSRSSKKTNLFSKLTVDPVSGNVSQKSKKSNQVSNISTPKKTRAFNSQSPTPSKGPNAMTFKQFQEICKQVIAQEFNQDSYAQLVSTPQLYKKIKNQLLKAMSPEIESTIFDEKVYQFVQSEYKCQILNFRIQFNDFSDETAKPVSGQTPKPVSEKSIKPARKSTSQQNKPQKDISIEIVEVDQTMQNTKSEDKIDTEEIKKSSNSLLSIEPKFIQENQEHQLTLGNVNKKLNLKKISDNSSGKSNLFGNKSVSNDSKSNVSKKSRQNKSKKFLEKLSQQNKSEKQQLQQQQSQNENTNLLQINKKISKETSGGTPRFLKDQRISLLSVESKQEISFLNDQRMSALSIEETKQEMKESTKGSQKTRQKSAPMIPTKKYEPVVIKNLFGGSEESVQEAIETTAKSISKSKRRRKNKKKEKSPMPQMKSFDQIMQNQSKVQSKQPANDQIYDFQAFE